MSTRGLCEIRGPSSARCNSTYFEIAMSECRTPATALASGRQGPAAQRQLATCLADPAAFTAGLARRARGALAIAWRAAGARSRSVWHGPAAFVGRPGTRGALAIAWRAIAVAGRAGAVGLTGVGGARGRPSVPGGRALAVGPAQIRGATILDARSLVTALAQPTGPNGTERVTMGSCRAQPRERAAERRVPRVFDLPYRACAPICLAPRATASIASGGGSTETS